MIKNGLKCGRYEVKLKMTLPQNDYYTYKSTVFDFFGA